MNKITESELTKLYYTIGEVSEMFSVNTSLIRFWHKEFDILKPKINKKGNRLFTPKDIVNLSRIYQLVKIEGFTLEGAKKVLKQKTTPSNPTSEISSQNNAGIILQLEKIKLKLLSLKK